MFDNCSDPFCPLERRGKRFKYRHTANAAAHEVGVPVLWIWYWVFRGRLRSKLWLKEPWFRLEEIENLAPIEALDTFLATRDYLSESEQRRVLRRFPWVEEELDKIEKRMERPHSIR